ncbi:MAG: type IV pili methyl-accepting chemotaxis transducer N-terminal domain-containing protein [Pseudomonadota bacterium]
MPEETAHAAQDVSASTGHAARPAMTLDSILPSRSKLSTKIVGALVGVLLLALSAIGITLYLSWQLEGSAAAINDTGSLRMSSYRLAVLLARAQQEPASVPQRALAEVQLRAVDATLAQLRQGDPQRPLFLPPTAAIHREFEQITYHWQRVLRPMAAGILARGPAAGAQGTREVQVQIEEFVGQVNQLVKMIERDSETRTFWLRASQLALLALALAGTVSLIFLMFSLIIEPVTRLHDGMRKMTAGDFSTRLDVDSDDEFGQLSQGFNDMAKRLQDVYDNLEFLVETKTASVEAKNRELALLYDSAAFLQLPHPLEPLCAGFMQRISDYFKADGGSVRVLDPERGNLHMVVHHGISKELVETEHCLKVGDCLCGEAVQKKVAVVHDLRKIDSAHQLQCHREGFTTVSVFHIYAQKQHLGFFNLHFRAAKLFDAREKALLETLGQLLGVAIESLRLGAREREMAVSEERNLVAQGLHDSIAQGLNFMNLQVQMLDQSLRDGKLDEVAAAATALRTGVKESYEDVRELLLNFRSRLAEGDLLASLQGTADKFRKQTGIAVELVADLDGAPFPPEQQLQLLFIVQEALSNVRKHAMANHVTIRLQDKQDFSLSIEDDGVGFDAQEQAAQGESHVGIHIMRERAQRIEASMSVTAVRGAGTKVQLLLPRKQRRAA